MKQLQRLTFFVMVGCLLFAYFVPVHAAVFQKASGSNAAIATPSNPIRIIEINNPDYDLEHIPPVRIIQNNTGDTEGILLGILPYYRRIRNISATLQMPDGAITATDSNVTWNLEDVYNKDIIDPGIPGQYYLTASFDKFQADKYIYDPGVSDHISVPIEVYVPDEKIPVIVDYTDANQMFALPVDGNLTDLLTKETSNLWYYELDYQAYHIGTYHWDGSTVDMKTPGIYQITGVFDLPMHCIFAPDHDVPQLKMSIIVQEPEKPELYNYTSIPAGIEFPWIVSEDHVADIRVWLSKDNGPWEKLVNEGASCWDTKGLHFTVTPLFTPNSSYRLQVDYRGGKTRILSLQYNDSIVITDSYEGDRDGGDTNGNGNGSSSSGDSDADNNFGSGNDTPPDYNIPEEDRIPAPPSAEDNISEVVPSDTPTMNETAASSPALEETHIFIEETNFHEGSSASKDAATNESSISSENTTADESSISSENTTAQIDEISKNTVTPVLPIVAAIASATAIASLLFLIFTKRRT